MPAGYRHARAECTDGLREADYVLRLREIVDRGRESDTDEDLLKALYLGHDFEREA